MKWTENDVAQISKRGIELKDVERQLEKIKSGPKELQIERACTPGDGIRIFNADEVEGKIERFENRDSGVEVAKFVPASGAASRMFRHLHEFQNGQRSELSDQFFDNLSDFAFSGKVQENFAFDISKELTESQKKEIAQFLISEEGLRFSNIPKGLVGFHREGEIVRSAFEEQLAEGVEYLKGNEPLKFHFTVAPQFRTEIENHLRAVTLKPKFSGVDFDFSMSVQEPATDTIAASGNGEPFREESGELLFRPGGHGALLVNLQQSNADIVFVKNIDNVVHRHHLAPTVKWKKALAGCLLELQEKTFQLIDELKSEKEGAVEAANGFLKDVLGLDFEASETDQLISLLDRPLRVCGMVKNQGEPGGGPFWVKDNQGVSRPQIVEKAQINLSNRKHREALESASHFNPVDLVCSMRRYNREFFDLSSFVDESTFFVSEKSKDGTALKALELPGLWNGAMAYWNTFFVEVPLETFNPVKTVNDLLKPLHQPAV
ncbi:DUF4301 family protein [Halocola ammonii]